MIDAPELISCVPCHLPPEARSLRHALRTLFIYAQQGNILCWYIAACYHAVNIAKTDQTTSFAGAMLHLWPWVQSICAKNMISVVTSTSYLQITDE
jgi:hypothetical protein